MKENIVKVLKKKEVKMVLNVLMGFLFLLIVYNFYTTFSMNNDYLFESVVYDINDNYIEGVSPATDVSLYYKYFDLEECSIKVYDRDNKEISEGYVVNGSKTVVYDVNDDVVANYINIIKGDYVADGEVDTLDFERIGECLIEDCSFDEEDIKALDIDLDGEVHVNDLTLLDDAVSNGYQNISLDKESLVLQTGESGRLVSKIEPSYGLNQNVKWISDDTEIVTVDEAGRLVGGVEGETKVRAITMDEELVAEAVVKVDNTIQLLVYEGVGYVGGDDIEVGIKAISYEGITCNVTSEKIASCDIVDKNMVISTKSNGSTEIVVTSPDYGEVVYQLTVINPGINISASYSCAPVNSAKMFTMVEFNTGSLSYEVSDSDIIVASSKEYYEPMKKYMLYVEFGNKVGRATLKVKESNGNKSDSITFDVYTNITVTASDGQSGSLAKMGEDVYATINGEYTGVLSCEVVNGTEDKATCRVEGNQLIVTPLALGSAYINVYNQFEYDGELYSCGSRQFMIVTQE